jgi:phthalate 4,5-cis-dihydrodiol dehydrogenase
MANGVMIYDDTEARLDPVPVPDVPRAEVIDEFYDAIVRGKPPLHDGAWSMATLEVCLAILQSSKTRSEVPTNHQIAVGA